MCNYVHYTVRQLVSQNVAVAKNIRNLAVAGFLFYSLI
nr:MAG TPA: hypothetical protein [Caudoviricetes sp.]